jgi:heat-inducible transcriptional repressor
MTDLELRHRTILQLVVEAYIDEAQPVSSGVIAQRGKDLKLSPATIRSVMAELTDLGLLFQPHTSAGRVPTERGLRVYLDGLMSEKLHPWDRSHLEQAIHSAAPSDVPAHLGHSLAGLSGQLAVVAVPRFLSTRFREVGLVRVEHGRFLAYFVSPGGLVQQKLVEVDFDLTAAELTLAQNYLNEHIQGRTLEEVREFVRGELSRTERDRLSVSAVEICNRALPAPEMQVSAFGASGLASQPEFADVARLRTVLQTIDDQAALLRLMDRLLDGTDVRVILGSEASLRDGAELACVGTRVSGPSGHVAIGVVGPSRMDYGRLVPMVRFATQLFSRYWQRV